MVEKARGFCNAAQRGHGWPRPCTEPSKAPVKEDAARAAALACSHTQPPSSIKPHEPSYK